MRSAIALLLLTATAHAGNNELSIASTNRALRTTSASSVTEDSLIGGTLTYSRRAALLPRLELWAQTSFAWGSSDGTMFQTLATEIDTLAFTAGGRLRYDIRRWLVASARLDVGATRAAFALHDDAGHNARDAGWGAITSAALGIDCYAFRGERYALGVRLELGAVATSSIPLTATPDSGSEGTLHLEMTAASLGSLDLSGPAFAASIVGEF